METIEVIARTIPICAECGIGHDDRPHMQVHFHELIDCDACGNSHFRVAACPPATAEKMAEYQEYLRHTEAVETLEREVIEAAVDFRRRCPDIQPDVVPKSIFDAGPTWDTQLNDFIRAVDRLIEEHGKQ